jgi:hypothetical protein
MHDVWTCFVTQWDVWPATKHQVMYATRCPGLLVLRVPTTQSSRPATSTTNQPLYVDVKDVSTQALIELWLGVPGITQRRGMRVQVYRSLITNFPSVWTHLELWHWLQFSPWSICTHLSTSRLLPLHLEHASCVVLHRYRGTPSDHAGGYTFCPRVQLELILLNNQYMHRCWK